MGAHIFKYPNQFTAYNFYPIELKFGRMILDISRLDRSEPDFRFPSRGRCGGAPLEIFKLQPIELELERMKVDMSLLNHSKLDFSISCQGALWGRASGKLHIDSQPRFLSD